jgi:hypothetical protein
MPSSRRRDGGLAARLATSLAGLALIVGACSAQPVSQVGDAQESAPVSAPASAGDATAPPSDGPESAPPTATPGTVPASAPPGKPTGTTFAIVSDEPAAAGGVTETHRITWQAPEGEATGFVVYGLKPCLRSATKNNGTPCVVKGMKIPRAGLVQLAQAAGADRSIDVGWVVPKSGKQPYAAILLRATNDAGESIFTIVHSEDVCVGC